MDTTEVFGTSPPATTASSVADRAGNTARKRKRPRAVQACERCRNKKYKCDELYPTCSHCRKAGADCTYGRILRSHTEASDPSYTRTLERRIEDLVSRLEYFERDVTATTTFSAQARAAIAVQTPDPTSASSPALGADASQPNNISQPHGPTRPLPSSRGRLQTPVTGQRVTDLPNEPTPAPSVNDNAMALVRQEGPHHQQPASANTANATAANDTTHSPHDSEITDLNEHTNEIEFHGNTSSMSFLGDLERTSRLGPRDKQSPNPNASLVTAMHNHAFARRLLQPTYVPLIQEFQNPGKENFYASYAHVFIEAYFSGIHYVHPFVYKESFMSRANALWFGASPQPSKSFIAMYLSLLALGSLTYSWPEERLGGRTRFEWSRKLFNEALGYLNNLQFSNDLETVHCLYFMAKICQNELSPHLAWTFLGRVVRTCISAGFNRDIPSMSASRSQELSRTWWGLYSLEVETSFALGRPDTLGLDAYHSRQIPEKDMSVHAIIPCMVEFSHIVRKVSLFYTEAPAHRIDHTGTAFRLESELDAWFMNLPPFIQPGSSGSRSADSLREPEWCRRQKLVLELRYYNVKLALFRGFIDLYVNNASMGNTAVLGALFQCANKCVSSAQRTIELMHDTFRLHVYFRTWWYNTTYIMVAAAALLSYIKRARVGGISSLVRLVEMSVEILDAMDESVVARKCAEILKRHLREVDEMVNNCGVMVPFGQIDATASDGVPLMPPAVAEFEGSPFLGQQILDYTIQDMASLLEGLQDVDLFGNICPGQTFDL
ncbi:hypothetical protein SEUCBS140593_002017 [Sporothrix eucalyptigena]|uniref:Zn(2)-C6 fungal-type domain-containing protein n=1 Tax=Sporothrix eucalyptigena TaxID=1812306 RepID=A0ABP0B344_9PEZI